MNKWWSIVGIGAVVALIGVMVWYTITPKNAPYLDASTVDSTATGLDMSAMYSSMKGDVFDKAYIADMIAHHQGALNMASRAATITTKDEIRELANDIVASQSSEIQQMIAWKQEWGQSGVSANDPHAGHIAEMSNAMSAEMAKMEQRLDNLTGEAYDKEFLIQMIAHHQQAVDMSKYAETNAERQEVKDLARKIIESQQKEINDMERWQFQWGY